MVFYWPALHNEIGNKKEDSFVIRETEKGDFATIAKPSHGIQNRSLKISIQSGNVGFSFFFPTDVCTG